MSRRPETIQTEDIDTLIECLVEEIDYDIYKELYCDPEDPEQAEKQINNLRGIIQRFLSIL